MTHTFTTKSGGVFTAEFSHRDYFKVNGVVCNLVENDPREGDCLIFDSHSVTPFLKTMGKASMSPKPDRIVLKLNREDFIVLSEIVATESARKEKEKSAETARIAALPTQHVLTYDGLYADGDCIPTEVHIQEWKIDIDGKRHFIGSEKWKDDFFTVKEAIALNGGISAAENWKGGYFACDISEEQAGQVKAIISFRAEKHQQELQQKEVERAGRRANTPEYTVNIEYRGDHELWNGVRMD